MNCVEKLKSRNKLNICLKIGKRFLIVGKSLKICETDAFIKHVFL
jgi:hypothetical protein